MDLTAQLSARTTSPIQRLPPEILALIFLHFPRGHRIQHAPLLLGRVNHTWRVIANSTPELWTTIHVFLDDLDQSSLLYEFAVPMWLERSRSKPLDIAFVDAVGDRRADWDPWDEDILDDVLTRLAPSCTRWRSLYCGIIGKDAQRVLDATTGFGGLPLLKRLVLRTSPTPVSMNDYKVPPSLSLTLAPNLLSVSLHYGGKLVCDNKDPPYALEVLDGQVKTSFADCFHLLQNSPSLKILGVKFTNDFPQWNPNLSFTHHVLTKLYLFVSDISPSDARFDLFLNIITLPSLQTLNLIRAFTYPLLRWLRSLPRFLQRSPLLQKLRLDGCSPDETIACILSTPNLRTLDSAVDASDDVLEQLTCRNAPEAGSDVAPYLTNLILQCTDKTSPVGLANMVISRWGGPGGRFPDKGQLLRLSLFLKEVRRRDLDTPDLARCYAEGLEVIWCRDRNLPDVDAVD